MNTMSEAQIQTRVRELIEPICEVLGDESDPAVILATIAELFAIYLSTYPADARAPILEGALKLAKQRLKEVKP